MLLLDLTILVLLYFILLSDKYNTKEIGTEICVCFHFFDSGFDELPHSVVRYEFLVWCMINYFGFNSSESLPMR